MLIAISLFVSVHFLLRLPLVQLWRQGNSTNPRWTLSMPLIAISEYGVPDKDQATLLMTLHFSSVECVVPRTSGEEVSQSSSFYLPNKTIS